MNVLKNSEFFAFFCPYSSPIFDYHKRRRISPVRTFFGYVRMVLQKDPRKPMHTLVESHFLVRAVAIVVYADTQTY